MFLNELQSSKIQLHSPIGEQKILFNEINQQHQKLNLQDRLKEIVITSFIKLRKYTQIKNINYLSQQQLEAFNDKASSYIEINKIEKETSKFEQQYYEYKQQGLSLQSLVSKLLVIVRRRRFQSIKPSHPLLILWSFLKFLLVLHLCFIFPLSDSFLYQLDEMINIQLPLFYLELIILFLDIIISLNVQIYNDGILIIKTQQIIKQYLKKEFFIDLCGLIGLLLFLYYNLTPIKYIFILKLKELSNFIQIFKYEIDPGNKFKNHIKLFTLLITVILLAHCFACIWIGVGQHSYQNNWIVIRGLENSHWIEIYLNALYFVITTMTTVGYGDITPINIFEVSISICLILFSSCIFAYIFNTITSVLKDLDANKSKLKHDFQILSIYMKKRNIDTELQKKVENYLSLVYQHQPLNNEKKIFNKLSPQLQQEINEQDKGMLLLKQPIFVNNFSFKLLRELIQCIQEINLTPQERLKQDYGLYIQMKGNLNIQYNNQCLGQIKSGDCIGSKSLFIENLYKKIETISEGFSTIYYLSTKDFYSKLKDTDLDQYYQIKDKLLNQNYDNLFLKCFLCRKFGHELCEDIQLNINKELILTKYNYSIQQQRNNIFKRKQNKKTSAFIKLRYKQRCANMCYQKTIKTIKLQKISSSSESDSSNSKQEEDSYDELEQSRHYLDENKDQIIIYDRESIKKQLISQQQQQQQIRKKLKGPSIVRFLQNYATQKLWLDDFSIIQDFDKMKNYRMYYPSQNYDQIIKNYNQWRKKINKSIKTHI